MAQANAWQGELRPASSSSSIRIASPRSMSMRLWGLHWPAHLPWHFDDGRAEVVGADEAMPFIGKHYPSIFGLPEGTTQFLPSPMTAAKRRFFEEMDFFMLRVGDQDAGIVLGHPSDWNSYYVRSAALLPEFRDRRVLTQFGERIYEPLRSVGVERIEVETSPVNLPMVRLLTNQGFLVTAQLNSERWGVMLRYTKFLVTDAHDAFVRQYTAMPFSSRSKPQPQRRTS